ncbi:MAG: dihydroorotase [Bacteroidia bacterium]|nr:dihydroorotase [Bacteroidia bacterium]MCZ2277725.1 dihydroorotase [Bacteroidia bacterium]
MKSYVIRNAAIVNEGKIDYGDLLIKGGRIEKTGKQLEIPEQVEEINAEGLYLMPGVIDDQVHFREPGLTHKAEIYSESRAAVAGGITSYMEMPNTLPNTLTQQLLEEKYQLASKKSLANYSFYMGVSNDNLNEVLKTDSTHVCGIKIFMGSSTGNMLVDKAETLEAVFSNSPMLIATHCEDEATIRHNLERFKMEYGEDIPMWCHPLIRNEEACYLSSSFALSLAKKHGSRLHVLHVSTAKETGLFDNMHPLKMKKITSEACIHHLWFSDEDYQQLGKLIKWNPAIKTKADRDGLLKGLLDNRIDVIATDHAPHTWKEKNQPYSKAPSGGPLVQHALQVMLELYKQGKIPIDRVVEKMSHAVADCFSINERGYIREGYYADLVLVDLNKRQRVTKENLLYKCRWSPFEGTEFSSTVTHTFVNGHLAFNKGSFDEAQLGMRMTFSPHHS